MQPRVSVIVPCRDDGAFLEQAVASALAQSEKALEVVVVDDGSSDPETLRLFDRWSQPRTRLLRLPPSGVSGARNAGIAEAQGAYILPLDADDRLEPAFAARTAAVLDARPEVGIVETDAVFFGARSGPWPRPTFSMPQLLLGNTLSPCSLFRRSDFRLTHGYDPGMARGWEDFDFWLSLVELGRVAARVPEALFHYRVRPGSRSALMTPLDWRRCYARILRNHPRLFARHPQVLPRYLFRMLTKSR